MAEWWDYLWIVFTTYGQNLYPQLPISAGAAAVDLATNSWSWLAELIGGFAMVLLYFPAQMLWVIINLLNQILSSLTGVINSVIALGNAMTILITGTFSNTFPSAWVALLGTIILLNIALRVYYFAKDISIAGFKI